jgi:aminomethyltransferase
VEVTDLSCAVATIGVSGPKAAEVLRAAGIKLAEMTPLELCTPKCDCDCGCVECTVVRRDQPGLAYEIWLAPELLKATWNGLLAAGATAAGARAVELRRIGAGVPRYGVDIRERDLPQETGQMRALNFTKGCYLGQEIVERIRSRGAVHRQFTGFAVEGPLPAPGTKIQSEGKDVGEVTSSAELPLSGSDRAMALGYLRREAAGKELRAGEATLKPAALPLV